MQCLMWIWIADTGHCFWRPPESRITWEDGVCWDPNRSLWFTHLRLRFFTYWGPFGLPKFEKSIHIFNEHIHVQNKSKYSVPWYYIPIYCLIEIQWNPHVTWNLRSFLLGVWSFAKLASASEPFLAAGWPWGHRGTMMCGVLGWDRQTHNNQNQFIWMISVAGYSLFEVDEIWVLQILQPERNNPQNDRKATFCQHTLASLFRERNPIKSPLNHHNLIIQLCKAAPVPWRWLGRPADGHPLQTWWWNNFDAIRCHQN